MPPWGEVLQPGELVAERCEQRADLHGRLAREALFETFERDKAVTVTVLVAGLARGADRSGDHAPRGVVSTSCRHIRC